MKHSQKIWRIFTYWRVFWKMDRIQKIACLTLGAIPVFLALFLTQNLGSLEYVGLAITVLYLLGVVLPLQMTIYLSDPFKDEDENNKNSKK